MVVEFLAGAGGALFFFFFGTSLTFGAQLLTSHVTKMDNATSFLFLKLFNLPCCFARVPIIWLLLHPFRSMKNSLLFEVVFFVLIEIPVYKLNDLIHRLKFF